MCETSVLKGLSPELSLAAVHEGDVAQEVQSSWLEMYYCGKRKNYFPARIGQIRRLMDSLPVDLVHSSDGAPLFL